MKSTSPGQDASPRWSPRGAFLFAVLWSATAADASPLAGSKHDFTTSLTGAGAAAGSVGTQTCVYCHTPHHANSARGLWNHRMSAAQTYAWSDVVVTRQGTPLGLTDLARHSSAQCLSCHDGTVAVGDLTNVGGGVAGIVELSGTALSGNRITSAGGAMSGGNLMGSHPVGVPYAGVSSYFGQRSAIANPAAEGYRGAVNGVVTGPGGHSLSLSRDSGGGYGIECTTCHDPHAAANARFLRHDMQGSKLCFVCHAL